MTSYRAPLSDAQFEAMYREVTASNVEMMDDMADGLATFTPRHGADLSPLVGTLPRDGELDDGVGFAVERIEHI